MGKRPYRIDPKKARERASKAGRASHGIDVYIRRIVDRAPELTPAQRDRLATALRSSAPATKREVAA